jgi:DNA-directed RNA polymerase specialized sigma24 family protein
VRQADTLDSLRKRLRRRPNHLPTLILLGAKLVGEVSEIEDSIARTTELLEARMARANEDAARISAAIEAASPGQRIDAMLAVSESVSLEDLGRLFGVDSDILEAALGRSN